MHELLASAEGYKLAATLRARLREQEAKLVREQRRNDALERRIRNELRPDPTAPRALPAPEAADRTIEYNGGIDDLNEKARARASGGASHAGAGAGATRDSECGAGAGAGYEFAFPGSHIDGTDQLPPPPPPPPRSRRPISRSRSRSRGKIRSNEHTDAGVGAGAGAGATDQPKPASASASLLPSGGDSRRFSRIEHVIGLPQTNIPRGVGMGLGIDISEEQEGIAPADLGSEFDGANP